MMTDDCSLFERYLKYKHAPAPAEFFIGIDPGVTTGCALRIGNEYSVVSSDNILSVVKFVRDFIDVSMTSVDKLTVIVEDARKSARASAARLQGAGSVKRDCKIWEEFFREYKDDPRIDAHFLRPDNCSIRKKAKHNAEYFKKLTGWTGRTNNHARDAAVLIYGL